MFVMQKRDTFIRAFGDLGYVTSQLTRKDRVYDRVGQVFLSVLARSPREMPTMVQELLAQFPGAPEADLAQDFAEFVSDLESDRFVVTGDSVAATRASDRGFSYQDEAPKTLGLNLVESETTPSMRPTEDMLMDYFRNSPTIFGLHVEVTGTCNERCVHCYQDHDARRHMDMTLARDLMHQLAECGTTSVTFSGGEPTLHPHFPELLQMAREADQIINVLTNGLNVSDDLVDCLREVNLNMCQISLYSMRPEVHDSITGVGGGHACTLDTIERLIAANVPVQVSCPIMRENKDAYRAVAAWCRERRIRVLTDFVMLARSNFDTSNLEHRLDLEGTREVISDILDADEIYHVQLETEPKTKDLERFAKAPVCGVCVDNACITSDGTLYPCSGFQNYPLGSIREQRLNEIWLDSPAVRRLRSITNGAFPKCLACEARDFCVMCLVRNFNESGGDMFRIADHFCQVAFLNMEAVQGWKRERARRDGASA